MVLRRYTWVLQMCAESVRNLSTEALPGVERLTDRQNSSLNAGPSPLD
jgi:hypothetical protein